MWVTASSVVMIGTAPSYSPSVLPTLPGKSFQSVWNSRGIILLELGWTQLVDWSPELGEILSFPLLVFPPTLAEGHLKWWGLMQEVRPLQAACSSPCCHHLFPNPLHPSPTLPGNVGSCCLRLFSLHMSFLCRQRQMWMLWIKLPRVSSLQFQLGWSYSCHIKNFKTLSKSPNLSEPLRQNEDVDMPRIFVMIKWNAAFKYIS